MPHQPEPSDQDSDSLEVRFQKAVLYIPAWVELHKGLKKRGLVQLTLHHIQEARMVGLSYKEISQYFQHFGFEISAKTIESQVKKLAPDWIDPDKIDPAVLKELPIFWKPKQLKPVEEQPITIEAQIIEATASEEAPSNHLSENPADVVEVVPHQETSNSEETVHPPADSNTEVKELKPETEKDDMARRAAAAFGIEYNPEEILEASQIVRGNFRDIP